MSTHNIGFYEDISKIVPYLQISSNTYLFLFFCGALKLCHQQCKKSHVNIGDSTVTFEVQDIDIHRELAAVMDTVGHGTFCVYFEHLEPAYNFDGNQHRTQITPMNRIRNLNNIFYLKSFAF